MAQRSFRLSDDTLADLTRIAEHLASLNRRAPNQTTALAWAIARGMDAIAKSEDLGRQIPDRMHEQLELAANTLKRIGAAWHEATTFAVLAAQHVASTRVDKDAEIADLRQRLTAAEAALERATATPYEPGPPSPV
jgi:plasmid stabilization system protein ParE